ncbi:MAG: hypothetical protein LW860_06550 [Xanthomonadaceae bacterium]|jgi:hypothetical protein|nr:hypothetical protein [Xanthomonadaceae bacterium]
MPAIALPMRRAVTVAAEAAPTTGRFAEEPMDVVGAGSAGDRPADAPRKDHRR